MSVLENLSENFILKNNWLYKKISNNYYILFKWFTEIPAGESYYKLPIITQSNHTDSIVLATPTGTTGIKPLTTYIRNGELYIHNQNTGKENFSLFIILKSQ